MLTSANWLPVGGVKFRHSILVTLTRPNLNAVTISPEHNGRVNVYSVGYTMSSPTFVSSMSKEPSKSFRSSESMKQIL
jgi:hypothetical protein